MLRLENSGMNKKFSYRKQIAHQHLHRKHFWLGPGSWSAL